MRPVPEGDSTLGNGENVQRGRELKSRQSDSQIVGSGSKIGFKAFGILGPRVRGKSTTDTNTPKLVCRQTKTQSSDVL